MFGVVSFVVLCTPLVSGWHRSHSFKFMGRLFMDATTVRGTPPENGQVRATVMMNSFDLKPMSLPEGVVCKFDFGVFAAECRAEMLTCDVVLPSSLSEVDVFSMRLEYAGDDPVEDPVEDPEERRLLAGQIPWAFASDGTDRSVSVNVSTWPLRLPKVRVAHTAMVSPAYIMSCGDNLNNDHCFRDWLEWHRSLGVEHFLLYDNARLNDSATTKAYFAHTVAPYEQIGLVTVVRWPLVLGGNDNNRAQRSQLNHALWILSDHTQWIAFFDIDEFFVPPLAAPRPNVKTASWVAQVTRNAPKLATLLNATITDPTLAQKVVVKMRNAQHPDACAPTTPKQTIRLSACNRYHQATMGHPKAFFHFSTISVPPFIRTPHALYSTIDYAPQANAFQGRYMHFTRKYGCKANDTNDNSDCMDEVSLQVDPRVSALEERLTFIDVCEATVEDTDRMLCYDLD